MFTQAFEIFVLFEAEPTLTELVSETSCHFELLKLGLGFNHLFILFKIEPMSWQVIAVKICLFRFDLAYFTNFRISLN